MSSFELSKLQGIAAQGIAAQAITPARALSDSDRTQLDARSRTAARPGEASGAKPGVAIEINAAVDGSQPPVDVDRVSEIRQALKDGTYPLVPTKIADAIIAARVGFGVEPK